jgi:hypothetical protein
LSSAPRKFERSRGLNALGPEVVSPLERRWSIRLRVASAMPTELSLKRLPVGAITSAPSLTQRLARGMSEVTTIAPGPARAAIQSSAASAPRPDDDPFDFRRPGNLDRAVGDDEHLEAVAGRYPIGLVLHGTGIGVDEYLRSGGVHGPL